MEDMLGYYKLRGEILRILLVLARHPEAQLIMKDEGFGDVVADVARDRSNPAMNRTLAIKVVFTMGSRAARQTWIVRRDGSRRRRGYDADSPWSIWRGRGTPSPRRPFRRRRGPPAGTAATPAFAPHSAAWAPLNWRAPWAPISKEGPRFAKGFGPSAGRLGSAAAADSSTEPKKSPQVRAAQVATI